jgi:hypothetical protein
MPFVRDDDLAGLFLLSSASSLHLFLLHTAQTNSFFRNSKLDMSLSKSCVNVRQSRNRQMCSL